MLSFLQLKKKTYFIWEILIYVFLFDWCFVLFIFLCVCWKYSARCKPEIANLLSIYGFSGFFIYLVQTYWENMEIYEDAQLGNNHHINHQPPTIKKRTQLVILFGLFELCIYKEAPSYCPDAFPPSFYKWLVKPYISCHLSTN